MMPSEKPGITLTRAGLAEGMRLTLPVLPGMTLFGMAYGAAAAQTSMSLLEALLSSWIVFAGAAQMVGLELWREHWTLTAILGIALIVGTVNSRLILMGASLHSWLGGLRPLLLWPSLFFLTDANWIISERYRAQGGNDAGIYIGSGLLLWVVWGAVTIPGYLISSLVPDPKLFGLDLVMPLFFILMLVPMWKSRADLVPWCVAGAVASLVWMVVPGYAFIVAGALAGALTAAFLPEGARV
jgi:predicted branched-subunit amino acid permease